MCKSNKKPLNKHFKKAQQVVELALVLPFFIITFSFVFQIMIETYSKYKFSYIFANSVTRAIELQQEFLMQTPFTDLESARGFNFKESVKDITRRQLIDLPYSGFQISDFQLDGINNYLAGIFVSDVERLIFNNTGLEYFYYIIPVNRIYFEAMILNVSNDALNSYYKDWYYTLCKELYETPASSAPPAGEGEGGETGEGEGGTPDDIDETPDAGADDEDAFGENVETTVTPSAWGQGKAGGTIMPAGGLK